MASHHGFIALVFFVFRNREITIVGGIVKFGYGCYMGRQAKIDQEPQASLSLAHDLNNELGIIIAECDLLGSTLNEEDAAAFRRLKMIKMSARRIADRISQGWPTSGPR